MTSSRSYNSSSVQSRDDEDLTYWAGAYVRVEATVNGVNVSVEGEVVRAKAALILLDRGKGKNQMLLELAEIRQMEEIPRPVPVTRITARVLATPSIAQVRQHLADRHGVPLRGISPLPEIAMREHDMMHRLELGHSHDSTRGTTDDSRPDPDEIAQRAAALDAEYANALECRSCGYVRRPEENGRVMHRLKNDDADGPAHHCGECADPNEYTYI